MRKIICLCTVITALSMLAACGGEPDPIKNETASTATELVVAGNEIACGVDPTVYPAADYLLNMGAAEILFKVDSDGVIKPSLAKGAYQLDEHTWEIELRPEATFWSGESVTAEAVIASLTRSKELDMKANPYLQGMEFTPTGDYTIQVITEPADLDITENLSNSQLVIHNTAEQYTYADIESADYTGMYTVVAFDPSQRMTFEKNENYWGNLSSP